MIYRIYAMHRVKKGMQLVETTSSEVKMLEKIENLDNNIYCLCLVIRYNEILNYDEPIIIKSLFKDNTLVRCKNERR